MFKHQVARVFGTERQAYVLVQEKPKDPVLLIWSNDSLQQVFLLQWVTVSFLFLRRSLMAAVPPFYYIHLKCNFLCRLINRFIVPLTTITSRRTSLIQENVSPLSWRATIFGRGAYSWDKEEMKMSSLCMSMTKAEPDESCSAPHMCNGRVGSHRVCEDSWKIPLSLV